MSAALMTETATDRGPDSSTPTGGRLVTTDGRELPLRQASIAAEARGGVARVVLTQRFVNPYDQPLLVQYQLPLPADGAVSGFSFTIGDQRVVGVVDRKASARERFEHAIAQGRSAALLEQTRSSLFAQKVGNIPPKAEVVAEVVVDQRLRWLEEGSWEWRFPTVVGPRYLGRTGRVDDAQQLSVDVVEQGLPATMTMAMVINDALSTAEAVESPSHHLDLRDAGADGLEVAFRGDGGVALDRDVVVRWQVSKPEVGLSLTLSRPADGGRGASAYGLLTIVPPDPEATPEPLPRDLIFLIDTSGSMSGRPLQQAVRVASAMIDTLVPMDQIELIAFGWEPRRWSRDPVFATPQGKRSAMSWLRKLQASGGTEMHRGIVEALRPLRSNAQRQVVLITDGLIGFEQEIVKEILDQLPPNSRLHTIGVGSAPNRSLTGPAARAGRGVELIVGLEEDAERVAQRLLSRTTAPLLTEVTVEGACLRSIAPMRLPDLFAGSPVLIALELDPGGGPVTVKGLSAAPRSERPETYRDGATVDFVQQIQAVPVEPGAGEPGVAALFGRERVEDLETMIAAGGDALDLDAQIEAVGLGFQLATRLTSWIAVTEEVTVEPGQAPLDVQQPHELPYGTSIEGLGLRRPATPVIAERARFFAGPAPAPQPPMVGAPAGPPPPPLGMAQPKATGGPPGALGYSGPPQPPAPRRGPAQPRPAAPPAQAAPPAPRAEAPMKRELGAPPEAEPEDRPISFDALLEHDEEAEASAFEADDFMERGAAGFVPLKARRAMAPVAESQAGMGTGARGDELRAVLRSGAPSEPEQGALKDLALDAEMQPARKARRPLLTFFVVLAIVLAIVAALWLGVRACAGADAHDEARTGQIEQRAGSGEGVSPR